MNRIHFMASLFSLILCWGSIALAQEGKVYEIPLAGNAFEIGHHSGRSTVGRNAAVISTGTANKTSVYFKVMGKGELEIKIKGKSSSPQATLKATFLGQTKDIQFSAQETLVDLGTFSVVTAGYQHVDLSGISGEIVVSDILVSGSSTAAGIVYCNDPNYYYWARRGPSCHLSYQLPTATDVSYYYNEVVVPEGEDVIGSYYMANGFGEGYFGIQVNSETERRVLFSVWSPFETDDPKSIPDDQKIVMLKKGAHVHTGEFGNEGSGGQSFIRYNWKAGETYRFLLKGVPDGKGNTDYSAWFFMPETQNWELIASFKRPKTDTYLKRFHSFLENFNPNQGYLTRKVHFNNQWVYDGEWKKVTGAKLTVDATYHANQRIDATGGKTSTGYFLKMGGFFDEVEKPGSIFEVEDNSRAPQIDFAKLP